MCTAMRMTAAPLHKSYRKTDLDPCALRYPMHHKRKGVLSKGPGFYGRASGPQIDSASSFREMCVERILVSYGRKRKENNF